MPYFELEVSVCPLRGVLYIQCRPLLHFSDYVQRVDFLQDFLHLSSHNCVVFQMLFDISHWIIIRSFVIRAVFILL